MPKNQITFGINFTSDSTQLKSIQQNLQAIKNITAKDLINTSQFKDIDKELTQIKQMAAVVEAALTKTFNPTLGTANLQKFTQEIERSGYSLGNIQSEFYKLGSVGQYAFGQVQGAISGISMQLKEAHPFLQKFATTLGNTIRYTFSTKIIQGFTSAIQQTYRYAQELDKSLNNIRIVTGKSSEEMAKFAVQANRAASALGASTTDYTNASLIYYQQGLGDREVQARTDVTVKVANITKQSADEVSQQLTAVWNGYQVSAQEAELYIDKLSAVAANSASSLAELSEAMSKVASAASAMGVDIDQLNAQISTIVSVTRQDAANVGTALKTIYARMGDLELDGADEFGVKLGDVSSKLAIMGVQVLDQQGNMRELGTVIEEVAAKWGTWTEAQQQAAAVALAGKRQYNNLIALFNNWDKYEKALDTSQDAEGTLQEQQERYMESIEAHLQKLRTAAEGVQDSLFDEGKFNKALDFFTLLTKQVGSFVDMLGGGSNALMFIGSILLNQLSPQVSKFLSSSINNWKVNTENAKQYATELKTLKSLQNELKQNPNGNTKAIQENIANSQRRVRILGATRSGIITPDQSADLLLKNQTYERQRQTLKTATAMLANAEGLPLADGKSKLEALRDAYKPVENSLIKQEDINRFKELTESDSLDNFEKGWESVRLLIDNISDKIKETEVDIENIAQPIEKFNRTNGSFVQKGFNTDQAKSVRDNLKILQDTSKSTKEVANAQKNLNNILNKGNVNIKNQGAAFVLLGNEIKRVNTDSLQNLVNKMNQATGGSEELTQAFQNFNTEGGQTEANYNALITVLTKINQETGQFTEELKQATIEAQNGHPSLENLQKDMDKLIPETAVQNLVNYTHGIMSLITVVSTVSNLMDTMGDDTVSTGEKIKQVLMGFLTMVPMLSTSLKGLGISWTFEGAMKKANAAATGSLTKAMWGLWASLGPILIIVAAITAALLVFKAVLKEIDQRINGTKYALEEANKNLEEQKQLLDDVKNAYEDLKSSIENYYNAQKAIDNLTVGTQEWKDAIYEANQQVLELLNTYKDLYNYITTDSSTGRMTISEEGLDYILSQKRSIITEAQNNVYAAQVRVNNANNRNITSNFGKNYGYLYSEVYGNSNKASIMDYYASLISEQINQNGELFLFDKDDFLNTMAGTSLSFDQDIINDIINNTDGVRDALIQAAKQIKDNTEQNRVLNRTIEKSYLINNEDYNESDYKEYIAEIVGNDFYQEELDKLQSKNPTFNFSDSTTWDWLHYTRAERNKMAQDYAEAMGGAEAGYTTDGWYVLKNGQRQKMSMSYMRNTVQENEARKNASTRVEDALNIADTNASIIKSAGIIDIGLINNILETSKNITTNISSLTKNLRNELDDTNIDNDELSQAIQDVADLYDKQFNSIITGIPHKAAQKLKATVDEEFADVSLDVQKNIGQVFAKAFEQGGTEAVDQAADFLKYYSGEQLEQVTNIFNAIDWNARGASSQFYSAMEEAGIPIKDINGSYSTFIDTLNNSRPLINDIIKDFESLKEQIQSVADIVKNIDVGGIISDEDYKALIAYRAELKDLFVLTKDGYKFIGDSKKDLEFSADENIAEIEKYANILNKAQSQGNKISSIFKQDNISLESYDGLPDFTAADYVRQALLGNKELARVANINADLFNESYGLLQFSESDITNSAREFLIEALGLNPESDDKKYDNDFLKEQLNKKQGIANNYIRDSFQKLDNTLQKVDNNELSWWNNTKAQQLFASRANSFEELFDLYDKGLIREDVWSDVHKTFVLDQVEGLGISTEAWQTYVKSIGATEKEEEKILDKFKKAQGYLTVDVTKNVDQRLDALKREAKFLSSSSMGDNLSRQIEAEKEKTQILQNSLEAQKEAYDEIYAMTEKGLEKAGYNNLDAFKNADGTFNYEAIAKIYKNADDELKHVLDSYMDWYDNIIKTNDELQDTYDNIHQIALEKYELTIQIKLDANQAKRDFYNAIKDFYYENDIAGALGYTLRDLQSYAGENGDLAIQMAKYQRALAAKNGEYDEEYYRQDGSLDEAAVEKALKESESAIYSIMSTVKGEFNNAIQSYLNAMQNVSSAFEKQMSDYEHIQSILQHDINLINLVYGDKAFTRLDSYYKTQSDLLEKEMALQQEQAEYWATVKNDRAEALSDAQKEMAKMAELYGEGSYEWLQARNVYDAIKQQLDYADEQFIASIDKRNDLLESLAQNIQTQYINAIDTILEETFNKFAGNNSTFDLFATKWELETKEAERYYDVVNRAYEIRKLEAKYTDSIKSLNGNVNAQQKLNKLMQEQLDILNKKDKLSEYDLKRANLIYEINLKQLQLEEARNNAVKMQLVRDADGNYRYQFVADEDAISKMQQELDDLQNNLWNLDVEEYKSRGDEYVATVREYKEAIKKAATMDPEEAAEYLKMINETYFGVDGQSGIFGAIADQAKTVIDFMSAEDYLDIFGLTEQGLDGVLPGFRDYSELVEELLDGAQNGAWDNLNGKITNSFNTMQEKLKALKEKYEEWNLTIEGTTKTYEELMSAVENANESLIKNAQDELNTTKDILDKIINVFSELTKTINEYLRKQEEVIKNNKTIANGSDSNNKEDDSKNLPQWPQASRPEGNRQSTTAPDLSSVDRNALPGLVGGTMQDGLLSGMNNNVYSSVNAQLKQISVPNGANYLAPLATAPNYNQNVTINADFPNATDQEEIEAAFKELIGMATQQTGLNNK